jgi:hypothetical protein
MNTELEFNTQIELFIGTKNYTVNSAPVGLLLLENDTIICKSEYRNEKGDAECTIVDTGENYCGGDKPCIQLIIQ